jgi:hypothetical protein
MLRQDASHTHTTVEPSLPLSLAAIAEAVARLLNVPSPVLARSSPGCGGSLHFGELGVQRALRRSHPRLLRCSGGNCKFCFQRWVHRSRLHCSLLCLPLPFCARHTRCSGSGLLLPICLSGCSSRISYSGRRRSRRRLLLPLSLSHSGHRCSCRRFLRPVSLSYSGRRRSRRRLLRPVSLSHSGRRCSCRRLLLPVSFSGLRCSCRLSLPLADSGSSHLSLSCLCSHLPVPLGLNLPCLLFFGRTVSGRRLRGRLDLGCFGSCLLFEF